MTMNPNNYCQGCGEEKHDGKPCDPKAAAFVASIHRTEEFRAEQHMETESGLALLGNRKRMR